STDGGVTWTEVTTQFLPGNYQTIHVVGTQIFVRTDNGVFLSTNNGATWNRLTGLPGNLPILSFASNSKYVFVLLNDNRVYAFPLS
ncbi:MAG TPA: regulator, partial [Blastocatellia bacterium]|nr:regulator [Blastocatellia bacterium]